MDDWTVDVDWFIEAYRDDTEELAWDLRLPGVDSDELEMVLRMALTTPNSYPVTVQQVIAAVQASSSDVAPEDLDLDADRLSFFLVAIAKR